MKIRCLTVIVALSLIAGGPARAHVTARATSDGSWRLLCTAGGWLLQGQIARGGRLYRFMASSDERPVDCNRGGESRLTFRAIRLYPHAVAPDALAGHQSEMPPPEEVDAVLRLVSSSGNTLQLVCDAGTLCRWMPSDIFLESSR